MAAKVGIPRGGSTVQEPGREEVAVVAGVKVALCFLQIIQLQTSLPPPPLLFSTSSFSAI